MIDRFLYNFINFCTRDSFSNEPYIVEIFEDRDGSGSFTKIGQYETRNPFEDIRNRRQTREAVRLSDAFSS
ncbi:MAG: hypothetical protein ABIH37_00460 [archaeon]